MPVSSPASSAASHRSFALTGRFSSVTVPGFEVTPIYTGTTLKLRIDA